MSGQRGARSARPRRYTTAVAVAVIVAAGAVAIWLLSAPKAKPQAAVDPPRIGAVADTSFPTTSGDRVSLASARGSKVILFFYDGAT